MVIKNKEEWLKNLMKKEPCSKCFYYAEIDNAPPEGIVCLVGWAVYGERKIDFTKPNGHCELWRNYDA